MKSSAQIIAETERLTIRLLTEADIVLLAAMWADAQVTRFMGEPRVLADVCASLCRDLQAATIAA